MLFKFCKNLNTTLKLINQKKVEIDDSQWTLDFFLPHKNRGKSKKKEKKYKFTQRAHFALIFSIFLFYLSFNVYLTNSHQCEKTDEISAQFCISQRILLIRLTTEFILTDCQTIGKSVHTKVNLERSLTAKTAREFIRKQIFRSCRICFCFLK